MIQCHQRPVIQGHQRPMIQCHQRPVIHGIRGDMLIIGLLAKFITLMIKKNRIG